MLSALLGVTYSGDVQDFVFRYLFVGLNVSLVLSVVYHIRRSTSENRLWMGKEALR